MIMYTNTANSIGTTEYNDTSYSLYRDTTVKIQKYPPKGWCPYIKGSDQAKIWLEGWQSAMTWMQGFDCKISDDESESETEEIKQYINDKIKEAKNSETIDNEIDDGEIEIEEVISEDT